MEHGKFITLEGTEGAGKSTALQFIQEYLEKMHKKIVVTREPGGTDIAEKIRHLLLHADSAEKMQPETELLLMFAGRAQHIGERIRPSLQAGKWVLSDRYIDASYAYQGGGREMNFHQIATLDKLVVGDLYPDLTLLLDVPADVGLSRTEKRGSQKDRIEKERTDFFVRVRNAYLERAKQDSKRIKIIDASQTLLEVHTQIRHVLDEFFTRIEK